MAMKRNMSFVNEHKPFWFASEFLDNFNNKNHLQPKEEVEIDIFAK